MRRTIVVNVTVLLAALLAMLAGGAPAQSQNSLGIPDTEYNALVALYNNTNGPRWANNSNWLTNSTPWYGVSVTGGHVTGLLLGSNALDGAIPSELGDLANLQYLYLDGNQLSGPIPPQLGDLTNLTQLILDYNQLSGPIPSELGDLANLEQLFLDYNQLNGAIPPHLGDLSNLYVMEFGYNQLSGTIPPELGNLGSLAYLYLDDNQLSGTIPPELGKLTNLMQLILDANHLSGTIPPELSNLSSLEDLDLCENMMVGVIPSSIVHLYNLSGWNNVSYNGLSSTNPDVLAFMDWVFGDWQDTETVPPTDVTAAALGSGRAFVSWTPIAYTDDSGYYEVGISRTSGGPYIFTAANQTTDKYASSLTVTELAPGTNYLVVRTVTLPSADNKNTVTSLLSTEVQPTAGLNKSGTSGAPLQTHAVVTAVFPDGSYYAENQDRTCGIRVSGPAQPNVGDEVILSGTLSIKDGEVQVNASSFVTIGQGSISPLAIQARFLGGGPLGLQVGITGASGLNNIGLLVRVWGSVTEIGSGCLWIDDGSNWIGGNRTGDPAHIGVMVICNPSSYKIGDVLTVTGISSCYTSGSHTWPRILTRGVGDIVDAR